MARLVKPNSRRALKRDIGFLEHSENVVRVSGRNFCTGEIQVGEMLQHRQRIEFVPGGVIQLGGRKIESSEVSQAGEIFETVTADRVIGKVQALDRMG